MARELQDLDISDLPEILRLAAEVQESNQPRLLKRDGLELAVITPVARARRRTRRRGIITMDDPLVKMAGTGDSGIPGGISGRKYDYFKKAFGVQDQGP